ncbi:MAG: hypothetical protein F6J93_11070 [Oscillatoria sp. SIO1A7]|nr:hypothetical protein [Oscillatoria sp. SIO1A7]
MGEEGGITFSFFPYTLIKTPTPHTLHPTPYLEVKNFGSGTSSPTC